MAKQFDYLFREQFHHILKPLGKELFSLEDEEADALPVCMPRLLERIPDLLVKAKDPNGDEYILHIEFQADSQPKMALRMQEYYGIIQRKHELPVVQIVLYIGPGKPGMPISIGELIPRTLHQFEFRLISIQDYDYQLFLKCEEPQAIILAVLACWEGKEPFDVLVEILSRLAIVTDDWEEFRKYYWQLEILSILRNLDVSKVLNYIDMPIELRWEDAPSWKRAYQQGRRDERKSLGEMFLERLEKNNIDVPRILGPTDKGKHDILKILEDVCAEFAEEDSVSEVEQDG